MTRSFRIGSHNARNIYEVTTRPDGTTRDDHVAVAFVPGFGRHLAEALNLWEATRAVPGATVAGVVIPAATVSGTREG